MFLDSEIALSKPFGTGHVFLLEQDCTHCTGKLVGVGSKQKVIDLEPSQIKQDWTHLSMSVGFALNFV
jgi:hypothetical protein